MWSWLLRVLSLAVLAALIGAAYFTRGLWWPSAASEKPPPAAAPVATNDRVILSDRAQQSLGLVAAAAQPTTHWRTLQVPGTVVDRAGHSDRAIVAPAAGAITAVRRLPGTIVRPGDVLFVLRLMSEPLHTTQADLYKATQDVKLAEATRQRLVDAGSVVPASRLIEAEAQLARLRVLVASHRQELHNRSFTEAQIDAAARGEFVRELTIVAPPGEGRLPLEVQELRVALGEQVQAGQTLCLLADHHDLTIEGRAFRDELPLIEHAARQGWPVAVDLGEGFAGDRDAAARVASLVGQLGEPGALLAAGRLGEALAAGWFPPPQHFVVEFVGNSLHPETRTASFRVPLNNQGRAIERAGQPAVLWRYRPGQVVRIGVPVERVEGVYVLPAAAVVRDGPEDFVFTQNVNTFERRPVRVLSRDRQQVVVAGDSLLPGLYVVQNTAAQLNRLVGSQTGGVPPGYHIHADGSLHRNDAEE